LLERGAEIADTGAFVDARVVPSRLVKELKRLQRKEAVAGLAQRLSWDGG
jgi:hypothetical protein